MSKDEQAVLNYLGARVEATLSAMISALDMSPPNLARALTSLAFAKKIETRERDQRVFYRIKREEA